MIKNGTKVELIKSTWLYDSNKKCIGYFDKKNPCKGIVVSSKLKKVAGNTVRMYGFVPDGKEGDCYFEFGEKWFKIIE
jgi:hypothetical protein